jgi:hypothetical protein
MPFIPAENIPTYFGFTDMHGFKDFLIYVYSYAPDRFPIEDWREASEQMNLARAFTGLQYGLDLAANSGGESASVAECRQLVAAAYLAYQAGDDRAGQIQLERVETLLKRVPTR